MKFGIFDQNDAVGGGAFAQYQERLGYVDLYEKLGFYLYHMSEHHGTPLSLTPSPSVFLAAISQRTQRLRFGPLVYLLPMYHPLRLAEEICMLDLLSDGRLEFGVGRGASPHELGFIGITDQHVAPMYDEALRYLLQGLVDGRMNGVGQYWSFPDVELSIRPVQPPHPPMWYAVGSPESAVAPARQGMNIVSSSPAAQVRKVVDRYHEANSSKLNVPLTGMNRWVCVAETDEQAKIIASRAWKVFYSSFINLWDRFGGAPGIPLTPDITPMMEAGIVIAGSASTVAEVVSQQIEVSAVNYFSSTFVFGDMSFGEASESINLFGSEVMPHFAEIEERRPLEAMIA